MLLVPTLLPVDQFSHSHPQRALLYYQLRNEFSARNTKEPRAAEKCSHFTPLSLSLHPPRPGSNIRGSQSSGVAISKWRTPRILRSAPSNSLWVRRGMLRLSTSVSYQIISTAPTLSFQCFSSSKVIVGPIRSQKCPKKCPKKNALKSVP